MVGEADGGLHRGGGIKKSKFGVKSFVNGPI